MRLRILPVLLILVLVVIAMIALALVNGRGPEPKLSAHGCRGVQLDPDDDIQEAIDRRAERTTFCLAQGTYRVRDNIEPRDGTHLIGAGIDATFLKAAGAQIVIDAGAEDASGVLVAHMDISGARGTPPCKPSCGSGFRGGPDNTIRFVRLHDNPNHGIGGSQSGLVVQDSVLDHNGSDGFTGCCGGGIKGGAGFTIENSEIYSNIGNGVWCDTGCSGGMEVYNNEIYGNSRDGIRYEISSGGAVIQGNSVTNNTEPTTSGKHGGITIVASRNVQILDNTLGNNETGGIVVSDTPRGDSANIVIRGNSLNGDNLSGCVEDVVCADNI